MPEDYEIVEWDEILKQNKIDIIATPTQLQEILEKIGNDIDSEGFIVKSDTKERELSIDSDEIRLKQVGAVLAGSKIFIKQNIAGYSQYLFENKKVLSK